MKTYLLYATEDQQKLIESFLKTNNIPFIEEEEQEEELPQHVLDGIKRGQEDIKAGRFITHQEFVKRMKSAK